MYLVAEEHVSGTLGYKHTAESKEKIKQSLTGRVFTPEHREKLRLARLGRSPANKGVPSPFRGLTYQQIGRSQSPLTGRPRSEEDRKKISKGHLKRFGDLPPSGERDASLSRQWTLAVKKRDNYTCQNCGVQQKDLPRTGNWVLDRVHAHHIRSWKAFPDLRFVVSNGITLCHPCHVEADTF